MNRSRPSPSPVRSVGPKPTFSDFTHLLEAWAKLGINGSLVFNQAGQGNVKATLSFTGDPRQLLLLLDPPGPEGDQK